MHEQLGMLKVNKLSKKDAKILVDYLKRLVEMCNTQLTSHNEYIIENPDEFDEDLVPKNFKSSIDKVATVITPIKNNLMDDKTAGAAYKNIKALLKICDDLNGYDFFGTEGWQHGLGLD